MAHSHDHARRLIRELEPRLPGAADIVLERPKYWDLGFVELFFEYTEELILRDPLASLHVARVARRLAHTMPEGDTVQGRLARRERRVKGHSLVGSAYRAAGRHAEAERAYGSALRLCNRPGVSPVCRAELYLRWAILRACQKKFDRGLRYAYDAERMFRADNAGEWLGRAYAIQGVIYVLARRFAEAVAVLSKALQSASSNDRFEYASTFNLAHAVSESDDPEGLEKALVHLRRARKLAGPRRSVQKSFFYWIEGRIFVRRGSTERAERNYRKALQGFIKFQTPYEIALVGLDLSSLFRFSKRWVELEELAADTYRRFRDLQEDAEALAALKLWLEGARARSLTIEIISDLEARLTARIQRPPGPIDVKG